MSAGTPGADLTWNLLATAHAFGTWVHATAGHLPGGRRGYILLHAISRGDVRSQLTLARLAGLDKTTVTYLVDQMVAAGLVERHTVPHDRRARRVRLTQDGRECLAEANALMALAEARLLEDLNENEAQVFRGLLQRIEASLSAS